MRREFLFLAVSELLYRLPRFCGYDHFSLATDHPEASHANSPNLDMVSRAAEGSALLHHRTRKDCFDDGKP
jgi:hypothetical protein